MSDEVRDHFDIDHGSAMAAMCDEAKRRWKKNEEDGTHLKVSPNDLAHWYEDVVNEYEALKDAGLIADAKDAISMAQEDIGE